MSSRLPLAATRLADLTEAWARDLRGAPTVERLACLDEADALRRAPREPDDSWRVLAAYRALADRALEGPEATARAVFIAEEDPARDGVTRRFAEVARRAPGDDGIRGMCAWAACAGDGADVRTACERLLEVHGTTQERRDAVAFAVLHALAGLFLRQHREFEALLAARRAADVAAVAPDLSPVDRAHAAALLARVFVGLGDAVRLRAHLPAMLAAADGMDEPDASRARAHAHLLVARTAIDDDDLDTATAAVAAAEAILRRDVGTPGFGPEIVRSTVLRLAVARRDVGALERCLAETPRPSSDDHGWLVGHVALAAARGAVAEATSRARRALESLAAAREIVVLEYLNAFCSHCRATHARLDRVVAGFDRPVRRHRVYVWSSREVPLWAKACAVAAQQGLEDAMFDALLETDRQDDRSIRAAAARAGVDLSGLDAPDVVDRLERDRRRFSQARLEGLPTFDVGRRRLMGEQSEGELLEALRAAAGS